MMPPRVETTAYKDVADKVRLFVSVGLWLRSAPVPPNNKKQM